VDVLFNLVHEYTESLVLHALHLLVEVESHILDLGGVKLSHLIFKRISEREFSALVVDQVDHCLCPVITEQLVEMSLAGGQRLGLAVSEDRLGLILQVGLLVPIDRDRPTYYDVRYVITIEGDDLFSLGCWQRFLGCRLLGRCNEFLLFSSFFSR